MPPIVRQASEGIAAFHAYDWYFRRMKVFMADTSQVLLIPCAQTKPIFASPLHRGIYQKFAAALGDNREVLVVSEPVVLIRYQDLFLLPAFSYDFPPKLLDTKTRAFFVKRLRQLLSGEDIIGCLPRHHASLVNDAIGKSWRNYWRGDLFSMMRRAKSWQSFRNVSAPP